MEIKFTSWDGTGISKASFSIEMDSKLFDVFDRQVKDGYQIIIDAGNQHSLVIFMNFKEVEILGLVLNQIKRRLKQESEEI